MNSVILTYPPLTILFCIALLCTVLTGCGKRLAILGWLAGMVSTVLLVLTALVMEATMQEIVTALTILLASDLLCGRGRERQ